MKITFTDMVGIDDKYYPYPAIKNLPEWYKKIPSSWDNNKIIQEDGGTPHTVKKCMPVFDAMTAGYIITTYVDIQVTQKDGYPYYQWPQYNPIYFHPNSQAFGHPKSNSAPFPKWSNPWSISTPKGYSTLFIPPMHRTNDIFTILPGIVDTDLYTSEVHFPFVLNDVNWTGIIPAGTPMAQVIPIKRDTFKMNIGDENDYNKAQKNVRRLKNLFFNSYKKQFWNRKEYR